MWLANLDCKAHSHDKMSIFFCSQHYKMKEFPCCTHVRKLQDDDGVLRIDGWKSYTRSSLNESQLTVICGNLIGQLFQSR